MIIIIRFSMGSYIFNSNGKPKTDGNDQIAASELMNLDIFVGIDP